LVEAEIDPFVVAKPSTDLRGRPNQRPTDRGRPNRRYGWETTTARREGSERTTAPALGDVEVVTEPEQPTHPLAGIVAALRHAGAPLIIVGCDFPFAPPALLRALAEASEPLLVPAPGNEPQPLMARWSPELLPALEDALAREEPLRRTVASLAPRLLDDTELARFGDPAHAFFNVNTAADLRAAAALL
jgi:molybdopterin-guanine dinucleotide biosynthesis protein A